MDGYTGDHDGLDQADHDGLALALGPGPGPCLKVHHGPASRFIMALPQGSSWPGMVNPGPAWSTLARHGQSWTDVISDLRTPGFHDQHRFSLG